MDHYKGAKLAPCQLVPRSSSRGPSTSVFPLLVSALQACVSFSPSGPTAGCTQLHLSHWFLVHSASVSYSYPLASLSDFPPISEHEFWGFKHLKGPLLEIRAHNSLWKLRCENQICVLILALMLASKFLHVNLGYNKCLLVSGLVSGAELLGDVLNGRNAKSIFCLILGLWCQWLTQSP